MNHSDKEIITQLKRGEEKAYRYLFDAHYPLLCRIAAEFLKDDFLAETIVGDVIFHLWEKRDTIEIHISIRAYLVRAVRNRCINYLQQEYVRKETSLSSVAGLLDSDTGFAVSDSYPPAMLLEKELEEKISESIESLPEECRAVFKMSRFEDMTYQEIAEKRAISVNTVKYHIKNALAKLSADLGKYLTLLLIFIT
ncbi:MAG: RNA polymerase sigma-70 factor [Prevotellaceae bacterium]|jgi:RNA polymerase sigma-70 factor (ECF subfamily)|nr:RNA polymerase sigma-70 factor [Prevotellaceae bacterium]